MKINSWLLSGILSLFLTIVFIFAFPEVRDFNVGTTVFIGTWILLNQIILKEDDEN